jgi:hypothetical protein
MNRTIHKFLITLCILGPAITNAQLIFPQGHEKIVHTSLDLIYDETDLPFIYPKGKITDLHWERLSDSIPPEWFVQACMNGTCLLGVPQNGRFENILNKPDSIGFLKYHFDFQQKAGTAIIKFLIYSPLSIDTAIFNVTYEPGNGIQNSSSLPVKKIAINPSNGAWTLYFASSFKSAEITDINGKRITSLTPQTDLNEPICIENADLSKGIYFLRIETPNARQLVRLMKY